jgi:hypothetical protein
MFDVILYYVNIMTIVLVWTAVFTGTMLKCLYGTISITVSFNL